MPLGMAEERAGGAGGEGLKYPAYPIRLGSEIVFGERDDFHESLEEADFQRCIPVNRNHNSFVASVLRVDVGDSRMART